MKEEFILAFGVASVTPKLLGTEGFLPEGPAGLPRFPAVAGGQHEEGARPLVLSHG